MTAPAWARHLPPGVPWEGLDLRAGVSIPRVVAGHAARDPDRALLHDGGWLTWGAVAEQSEGVAGRLAGLGLQPGDRLLCSASASASLVVAHLAALRMGLVVVPLNTAYQEAEVAHVVADAAPAAAIVDRADAAGWLRSAGVRVVGPSVDLPDGPVPALDRSEQDDPAMICYTSGTTGRPKGAVLRHGNLLAAAEAVRLAWRWSAGDRLLLALPLFHMHGLGVGVHGSLVAGASMVLVRRFDPAAVLAAVGEHDATLFFGVPTMYARLAEHPSVGALGRLRLCVSGSAPLDPSLHRRLAERCGQSVLERYGMTETLMLVSNPYDGERRAGTVGFPLPGVELRLSDGEIVVRGPSVFAGYRGRDEGPDADGWFATGDIGELGADGYLRIVGRSKELIITGGFNVYPREVEDVLLSHPAVAEAAVVGVPSEEWGETVVAYVVQAGNVDRSELIGYCRDRLAHFKCPRQVIFVASLPRNALGKVLRDDVRRLPRSAPDRG